MPQFIAEYLRFKRFITAAVILYFTASLAFAQNDKSGVGTTEKPPANTQPDGLLPLEDYSGDLLSRSYLVGDWGGVRSFLAARGVLIQFDASNVLQGVATGGNETGTTFGTSFDFWLHLDLHRMEAIPGGLLSFRVEADVGDSITGKAGTVMSPNYSGRLPVANELDDNTLSVTDLYYTQFFGKHFGVFFGRFDTHQHANLAEFAGMGPNVGKTQFLNMALNLIPVVPFTQPYVTSLGFGVIIRPSDNLLFSTVVMDSKESSQRVGLEDFGSDWNTLSALRAQYRLFDLPGGQTLGVSYSWNGDYRKTKGPPFQFTDTTWAVFYNFWQYFQIFDDDVAKPIDLRDGRPDHQGWGAFFFSGFADQDTNPIQWSVSGGIGGRGVIPGRENDTFGIGYYYVALADLMGLKRDEQGVELFYNIEVVPWFHLTPDLQIVAPGIEGNDTVVIAGLRGLVSF